MLRKDGADYVESIEGMIGKTIERIAEDVECGIGRSYFYITFTDGCRAVIEAHGDYGGGALLEIGDPPTNPQRLSNAGWMSDEEFEKWEEEYDASQAKRRREADLKQLAELKAKYESTGG